MLKLFFFNLNIFIELIVVIGNLMVLPIAISNALEEFNSLLISFVGDFFFFFSIYSIEFLFSFSLDYFDLYKNLCYLFGYFIVLMHIFDHHIFVFCFFYPVDFFLLFHEFKFLPELSFLGHFNFPGHFGNLFLLFLAFAEHLFIPLPEEFFFLNFDLCCELNIAAPLGNFFSLQIQLFLPIAVLDLVHEVELVAVLIVPGAIVVFAQVVVHVLELLLVVQHL